MTDEERSLARLSAAVQRVLNPSDLAAVADRLSERKRASWKAADLVARARERDALPGLLRAVTDLRPESRELIAAAVDPALQSLTGDHAQFIPVGLIDWLHPCVCRVEIDGVCRGTGFLIGPDLVVTCWHVLWGDDTRAGDGPGPTDGVCFRFDIHGRNAEGRACRPAAAVAWSDANDLDFALIRLTDHPGLDGHGRQPRGEVRGWLPVADLEFDPAAFRLAVVVQHPSGDPLSLHFGPVLEQPLVRDRRVVYRIDTSPGSSGSPCVLRDRRLLALHRAGGGGAGGNMGTFFPLIARRCKESFGLDLTSIPPPRPVAPWRGPIMEYLEKVPRQFDALPIRHGYVPPEALVSRAGGPPERVVDAVAWALDVARSPQAKHEVVLILGGYGSGKSSLLRVVWRDLARAASAAGLEKVPIPIFYRMGAIRDRGGSMTKQIVAHLGRVDVPLDEAGLNQLLNDETQDVVLLLDGLDEFADRVDYKRVDRALRMVRDMLDRPATRVFLTCRDTFFPSDDDVAVVHADRIVRLEPIDDGRIRRYLDAWRRPLVGAWDALKAEGSLLRVCQSPMHLFLFCEGYAPPLPSAGDPAAAPTTRRVDLYAAFAARTLGADQTLADVWNVDERQACLCELAYRWHHDGVNDWGLRDLKAYLREYARANGDEAPAGAALDKRALSIFACSFFARTGNRYRFTHQSFQEYLIARGLAEEVHAAGRHAQTRRQGGAAGGTAEHAGAYRPRRVGDAYVPRDLPVRSRVPLDPARRRDAGVGVRVHFRARQPASEGELLGHDLRHAIG